MNEPELKEAARRLAERTPQHLGKPTTPSIRWKLEGSILRVLLADGRTVRASLESLDPKPAATPANGQLPLPGAVLQPQGEISPAEGAPKAPPRREDIKKRPFKGKN